MLAVSFLSAFPAEKEILYPPLTFLQPTGKFEKISFGAEEVGGSPGAAFNFTVIEVEAHISS